MKERRTALVNETLYELVSDHQYLVSLMADPTIDKQLIDDSLESVKASIEVKAEGYCKVLRTLEAKEKAFQEEADFYQQKATTTKNNIARLKTALCEALIATGHDDKNGLEAGNFTLKVAGNGGKLPLLIDGDVPDNYSRIIVQPDTELIRKALDRGEELPFAHYGERGKHLSIR